jgi:hypothetical protein
VELGSDILMIRYLLGQLSEEEETQFEERYFSDDQVFEDLQTIETELIDSYVKGELSDSERQRFDTYYLNSSERRNKVEMASCLMASVAEAATLRPIVAKPTSIWRSIVAVLSSISFPMRIGYAVATVAILAVMSITLIQNYGLRSELGRLRTERVGLLKRDEDWEETIVRMKGASARQAPSESPQEIAQAQAPHPLVASITLTPSLSRGLGSEANNRLIVPSSARWVVVNLSLDGGEDRTAYRAVVETVDGNEVLRVDRLKNSTTTGDGKIVSVGLQVELLSSDTYVVKLSGITANRPNEEIADYSLEVIRR